MNSDKINILFTGLSGNDSALQPLINSDKINLIHFPTIEIGKAELSLADKNKIKIADGYDFIIFTSVNAVKYFLLEYGSDHSSLGRKAKIVAIGDKTASVLISKQIDVDLIPKNSSSKSIDELLTMNLITTKSVLIPCSKLSKVDLSTSLESKGALVDFIPVYENIIPANISSNFKQNIIETNFDLYIFTSPSTFHNFLSIFEINDSPKYFENKNIASIGPVTTEAIEKHNITVTIEPIEFNLASLTKRILEYYKLN